MVVGMCPVCDEIDIKKEVDTCIKEDNVSLEEIDVAYLRKHNELMTLYKAYQKLYGKTVEYKSKLDNIRPVRVQSILSREQMARMVDVQNKIMSGVAVMQENMLKKGILTVEEIVPINNVSGKEIEKLNDNLEKQIQTLIQKDDFEIDDTTKQGIRDMVENKDK